METKPLDKMVALELENLSLKLNIMKRNEQDLQQQFQAAANKALSDAGLSFEEWAIDLDKAMFVPRRP